MDKVAEELPGMGTALAGLILVFLGMTYSAFDSYDADAQNAVRGRYRTQGWIGFVALVCAVVASAFGLIGIGNQHFYPFFDWAGIILLALSAAGMGLLAIKPLLEI
jgi:hypothetical protein